MIFVAAVFSLLFLAFLVAAVVGLIYPKPFRNRKTGEVPPRMKVFWRCIAASFACAFIGAAATPETEERKLAKAQAVADAAAAEKAKAEQAARAEQEKKAQAERLAAAEKEKAATCRQDLSCWGEKHLVAASFKCANPIERMAQYQHEWTDGFLEMKLSHFKWLNRSEGTLSYFGDKIKFQNGFGAWQNYTYQCDYDPDTEVVLAVDASPGRI